MQCYHIAWFRHAIQVVRIQHLSMIYYIYDLFLSNAVEASTVVLFQAFIL